MLLMHVYTNFNMILPGPQVCCSYEMCAARPWNEHSPWKLRSRDICEKAKQNSAKRKKKKPREMLQMFSVFMQ